MNTKGIKFLAVLAVLAMAFAALAVIVPTQENDATSEVPEITTLAELTEAASTEGTYYISGLVEFNYSEIAGGAIKFTQDVTFIGKEKDGVKPQIKINNCPATGSAGGILMTQTGTTTTWQGIKFTTDFNGDHWKNAVLGNNGKDCNIVVDRCIFEGAYTNVFIGHNGSEGSLTITDSEFTGGSQAIYPRGGMGDITITGCIFYNAKCAIALEPNGPYSAVEITDNTFYLDQSTSAQTGSDTKPSDHSGASTAVALYADSDDWPTGLTITGNRFIAETENVKGAAFVLSRYSAATGDVTTSSIIEAVADAVIDKNAYCGDMYYVYMPTGGTDWTFEKIDYEGAVAKIALDGDSTLYFFDMDIAIKDSADNGGVVELIKCPDAVTLSDGAVVFAKEGFKLATKFSFTDDTVSTADLNVVAGKGGLYIGTGSIVISGVIDASTAVTITSSGDLEIDGVTVTTSTTVGGLTIAVENDDTDTVTVTDYLVIDEGAKLTIDENTVLAIDYIAEMEIKGAVEGEGSIDNEGTIYVSEDAEIDVDVSGEGKILPDAEDEFGIEGTLDSDYTISTSAYLSGDLIIPEGITLTVNGTLKMLSKDIYVRGQLVIGGNGIVTTTTSAAEIFLNYTGTITNNGVIGSGSVATITMEGSDVPGKYLVSGTAYLKDVSGVQFGVTKVVGTPNTYYLTVSGDVGIVKGSTDYGLMVADAKIGDLNLKDIAMIDNEECRAYVVGTLLKDSTFTIGSKTVAAIVLSMESGSVLDVYGTLTDIVSPVINSIVHLKNGATVNVYGDVTAADFNAYVGEYNTYVKEERQDPEVALSEHLVTINAENLKGISITVSSRTFTKISTPMTEQMLSISGDSVLHKDKKTGSISVTGQTDAELVYVLAGSELNLPDGADISATKSNIVTKGLLTGYDLTLAKYIGAKYEITTTVLTVETTMTYYTTFDDAYPNLSICDDYTISVRGGYTFTGTYTIEDGQTVYFASTDVEAAKYVIASDAVFTVKEGGVAIIQGSTSKAAGFTTIEGYLIVEIGGACVPDASSYQVSSISADKTITYTGIAKALADAEAGDVIILTQKASPSTLVTVPALVTLKINEGVILNATKGLTVNGILVNAGTVNVSGGDLAVNGVYDNTEGTTTVTGEKYSATITGLYTGDIEVKDKATINAATFNNGEYNVYTTPAGAAALVALMDVPVEITVIGKVTDDAEVVLTDGMSMTISGTVKVPSITVKARATLTVAADVGKLTTTVIGDVGSIIAIAPEIDVTGIRGTADVVFKTTYNEATSKYTTTMSGFTAGTAIIDQGSVTFEGTGMEFSDECVLGVSSGATMTTSKAVDFKEKTADKYNFFMYGTWNIKNTDNKLEGLAIDGSVSVAAGATVTLKNIIVTGEFVLAGATSTAVAAKATVEGTLIVGTPATDLGDAAAITGSISFGDNAYAIVYGISSFVTIDEDVVDTAFVINDELFATVYGEKNTDLVAITAINEAVKVLEYAGYVIPVPIKWQSGSDVVSTTTKIGAYDMATLTLSYKEVTITYTPEPGTILYIDGIKVDAKTATISVGIHTVAVYLELGYQGDLTVKFNGKTLPVTASGITLDITPEMQLTTNALVVSGAEPIPEPEPVTPEEKSEWTVTTILLCVLVVLIAIMAVIVALRLNRS